MNDVFKNLRKKVERDVSNMSPKILSNDELSKMCDRIGATPLRVLASIGTLGGG